MVQRDDGIQVVTGPRRAVRVECVTQPRCGHLLLLSSRPGRGLQGPNPGSPVGPV